MTYMDTYDFWVKNDYFDEETRSELEALAGDEAEIEDRFYQNLEFGTGGLRGKIGAGTNRINRYTVAKATQGFADFISSFGEDYKKRGVVIAYDSRYKSKEFAERAALVLAGNGVKAYVFEELRPTPELSFAVRHLKAAGGIVITASHNPPAYNGYKVYWEDGAQMVPDLANQVIDRINSLESFEDIKEIGKEEAEEKGLFESLGKDIDAIYIEKVKGLSVKEDVNKDIKVVYTPLHGTGNQPVRRVLDELGYEHVWVVKEQEMPDAQFSTVDYPNPEDPKAFRLAMDLAGEVDADILLGTDPDCDRVGVVVKNAEGDFVVLNGNQTGALLLDYILSNRETLPKDGVLIKTIVTSELGRIIASQYGLETLDTLTGFKFIGEKMKAFEETGDKSFVFGYEESFGYLTGTFVRDKDAVIASMLICEMAADYKEKGLSLYEGLQELYKKYGYYVEDLHAISLEGIEGKRKIDQVMESFRKAYPTELAGVALERFDDYKRGETVNLETEERVRIDLPKSNVLKYVFADGSWYALRPSGTEPKLKVYISTNGNDEQAARDRMEAVKREVVGEIEGIVK